MMLSGKPNPALVRDSVHAVVLPRTDEQREYVRELALPSVIVNQLP